MNPSKTRLSVVLTAAALAAACASNPSRQAPARAPAPAAKSSAAPSAPAAAAAPAADPAPAMPTSLRKAWGVVESVDAAAGRFTLKDHQGRERVLRLAAGATLTRGGGQTAIALADVKAGDRVTVRASGDVAGSVHVNVRAAAN